LEINTSTHTQGYADSPSAPNEALDKSEQNFVANVREHGWFRTDIFEEEGHPGFSYSTGFWVSCASRNSLCMDENSRP
jgi:hypothetical protein